MFGEALQPVDSFLSLAATQTELRSFRVFFLCSQKMESNLIKQQEMSSSTLSLLIVAS